MAGGLFGLGKPQPSRFPYPGRPQPSPGIAPSPGTVVKANKVIVFGPGGGIFIYSGTPAHGNLIGSWASSAGTDQFGNAYPQGLNVTVGQIIGSTIENSATTPLVRLTTGGNLIAFAADGTQVWRLDLAQEGFFLYADSGGGGVQGGLVASLAAKAGTDGLTGTAYKANVTAYGTGANTTFVQMAPGTPAAVSIGTGDAAETRPGRIIGVIQGAGATRQVVTQLEAAKLTGEASLVNAGVQILSPSVDLATDPVSVALFAQDAVPNVASVNVTPTLVTVAAPLSVTGAATFNKAVTISDGTNNWAADRSVASANVISKVNPTAPVDITDTFTIPANSASAGTTFCIEMPFTGIWEASGALNLRFDLNGTITNLVPLAAGLATAGHNYGGTWRLYLQVLTTGAGGTCNIWGSGDATDTSQNRAGATSTSLFGINAAHAFNTTIANTLAIAADFAVSNVSQTVVGQGSTFTRKGA